ncbi:hypothetical protein VTO73DRAFT_9473 [Trametes versicolor]
MAPVPNIAHRVYICEPHIADSAGGAHSLTQSPEVQQACQSCQRAPHMLEVVCAVARVGPEVRAEAYTELLLCGATYNVRQSDMVPQELLNTNSYDRNVSAPSKKPST